MPLGGALTVGGLVAGGNILSTWMASDERKNADAATVQRLDAIYQKIDQNYKLPTFDQKPLTPEEYKVVGQYSPKVASYVQEKAPQLLSEQGSQAAKQAQNQALSQYQQLSQTGVSAQDKAQQAQAFAQAAGANRQSLQNVLQSYQQRGLGGGGQELLAEVAGGQQNQSNLRQSLLNSNAQNEQMRQQALSQMAGLAGNIRGQNLNVEQANTSAINAFNQRNAMNLQKYNEMTANTQNQAQQYNLNNAQQNANSNTTLNNNTSKYNQQYGNQLQSDITNAANNKLLASTNAQMGVGNAQSAAANNAINSQGAILGAATQGLGTIGAAAMAQPGQQAALEANQAQTKYLNSLSAASDGSGLGGTGTSMSSNQLAPANPSKYGLGISNTEDTEE